MVTLRHGSVGAGPWRYKQDRKMVYGRLWTEEEKRIIREMYPDHFASEIAEILGRTVSQVQNCAARLGVRSSYEKRVRSGRMSSNNPNTIASRFKKGYTPPNKGKKMPAEVYARCAPTMFKKGNRTHNYKPVGSERVNVDGYVEVKVADPGKWRLKHRVIWEEAHGPIPRGHNVQFRDGNSQNLSLDNLYLISRSEQMKKENCMMARYPQELREVIHMKASIKRQITIQNKRKNGEES